jgi:serine/threonine protein kinase
VCDVGFSPDDRIGNYRVETVLGPTGSGILLQVQHLVLPRRAIIKVVHSAFAAVQSYVLQTLREACILEAIAHPGVPVIFESGVLRDRRPWFAFEMVGGPTLEELIEAGPVSLIEVAGLLRDISDILEHAHRRGVIHRGLRPERIVITSERRYPLCIPDWSESMAHDATSHLPQVISRRSRSYVAPELAHQGAGGTQEVVDDRVDMFALGVIAYRALTGCLPFARSAGAGDASSTSDDDDPGVYVRAQDRRPDAMPELTAIIDSLLSFDRFDRPSASEVRADVDWLFDTLPELRSRVGRRDAPVPGGSGSGDGGPGKPDRGDHGGAGAGAQRSAAQPGSAVGPRRRGVSEDIVLLEQPRLRRPRWTPDVRYLDTTHVDIDIEDELANE